MLLLGQLQANVAQRHFGAAKVGSHPRHWHSMASSDLFQVIPTDYRHELVEAMYYLIPLSLISLAMPYLMDLSTPNVSQVL